MFEAKPQKMLTTTVDLEIIVIMWNLIKYQILKPIIQGEVGLIDEKLSGMINFFYLCSQKSS